MLFARSLLPPPRAASCRVGRTHARGDDRENTHDVDHDQDAEQRSRHVISIGFDPLTLKPAVS